MKLRFSATALAVSAAILFGCESTPEQAKLPPDTLQAIKVAAAPVSASDPVWARAQSVSFEATGGSNHDNGSTTGSIKAVYTADMLYLLLQYKDATHNDNRRGPYQKQGDGSWKKLKDPADKGGDDNVYYEDKFGMFWPIGSSVKNFDAEGCAVACHKGQGKPYGNKYLSSEGELADMWHWKAARSSPWGKADDGYVDHTRYDAKTSPNAGRKGDPGNAQGDYTPFEILDGKPQFMAGDARALQVGGTTYIKRGSEVPFVDNFKAADEVASYITNPLQGDRGDVSVVTVWKDGVYTHVISRKLATGSKYDVQFNDLGARYGFGLAIFDNAQVRHATVDDPLFLVFGK